MFLVKHILLFSEGHAAAQSGLLDVEVGLIFWTIITFLLLLLILGKFAWKPILAALAERENFIKDSLEKAEKAQKDAEELAKQNAEKLNKAQEESAKIIAESKAYAEKVKENLEVEAKAQAAKIIENAKVEAERVYADSFNKMKSEIVDIAIQATEKVLQESVDKDKHTQIISKYIDNLNKN